MTDTYTYLYRTNIQGDVVGVYNTEGTLLVSYVYDAWGNFQEITHTSSQDTAIASSLPFRYRSYYYDTELGMYYLNTRYYDPQIGRFINADMQLNPKLLGYTLFAYVENNPIKYSDTTGEMAVAATNFWNPAGWIAGVILVVGIIIIVDESCYIVNEVKTSVENKEKTQFSSKEIDIPKTDNIEINYWAAERIGNKVFIGMPITGEQASARVARGESVMCRNDAAARHIIFLNGYINAVGPEIHGGAGYYWHYHPTRNHTGRKDSTHICFYAFL